MLKPCQEWNERISAYLDGELAADDQPALEQHLRECDACRATVELYRCDQQDTSAALLARSASEAFAAGVMQQIAAVATDESGSRYEEIKLEPVAPRRAFRMSLIELFTVLGVMAVLAATLFPVFAKAREKARSTKCTSNQRQLALATIMYSQDHSEILPSAANWTNEIGVPAAVFQDPTAKYLDNAYAYNMDLDRKNINSITVPDSTPVTYDARDGLPDYRHDRSIVMSYLDGHIELHPATKKRSVANSSVHEIKVPLPKAEKLSEEKPVQEKKPETIIPPKKNYGLSDKLLIAYKASMTLESESVQGVMENAELLFHRYDGFVLTSEFTHDETGIAHATVSGRVPGEKLGQFLIELDKLGTVTARVVNGEDLTGQHLEQSQKLENLSGSQRNLEHIRNGSGSTSGQLNVEEKRNSAAGEASGVRVEEYNLKSRVTLAEVSVEIREKPKVKQQTPYTDAATGALHALGSFGRGLVTVLIPLLIWIPVWGPLVLLAFFLRRWWLQKKAMK